MIQPSLTTSRLEADFERFDRDNPEVYILFERFALQAIAAGRKRIGARLCGELVRWETSVVTKSDDGFKVNDHNWPHYARKFQKLHPEHANIFTTRKVKGDVFR